MEVKYEPIFGDQSLFDGAPEDAEAVGGGKPLQDALVFYKFSDGEFQYKYEAEIDDWKVSTCKHPQSVIKAMRRIIKEPKRWTRADMDAGRLPEVGCVVMAIGVNEVARIAAINNDSVCSVCVVFEDGGFITLPFSGIAPIETPAEKAKREEDAFVKYVMKDMTLSLEWNCIYERGVRAAYRKLKGGE